MKILLLLASLLFASLPLAIAPAAPQAATPQAAGPQAATPAARPGSLADVAFLAGHWAGEEDGTRTEEAWLVPAGGLMLGVNRSVLLAADRASFEYLRIEQRPDGVVYVASPGGKGATEFRLEAAGPRFAEFTNPAHDFPKAIRYELDAAGALHARVTGDIDGRQQSLSWTWKRQ